MSAENPDQVHRLPIVGRKRPIEAVSQVKKLRSKIPRRKRIPHLPIVGDALLPLFISENDAESSCSCLHSEVTFESSQGSKRSPGSFRSLRKTKAIRSFNAKLDGDEFRRITRSYSKQQERFRLVESKEEGGGSGVASSDSRAETKKSKGKASDADLSLEVEIAEVSRASGGSVDGNVEEKPAASESIEIAPAICESSVSDAVASGIADPTADGNDRSNQAFDLVSDLACSEQLSEDGDGGSSAYSTCNEMTLSEMEMELFHKGSDGGFSDYSLYDKFSQSTDGFSERSLEDSIPSATFSLFLQLAQQLARLCPSKKGKASSGPEGDSSDEFTLTRFEEEEDEESYKLLRSRERKGVVLYDYAKVYISTTDYGDLILEQRMLMVNWMVEYANDMELQNQTLFLGTSLMDRFLSEGFFKTVRNLQLLGIACVTLATRLEENQPYNSVRLRSFTVGSNIYSRCEVVAMEWLVMEVIKFKCFLPTIHNFLWFYLKAARVNPAVESLARYLAILSLLDHERLTFWPSTVAAGIVILACHATNHDASCHVIMETHVRNKNNDLPECIQSLEWLVKYAC